ncbi:MAG: hypothetical protein Q8M19_19325 [Reyranella sp.]|nr:hypothetical protein [Reyranella sp.]
MTKSSKARRAPARPARNPVSPALEPPQRGPSATSLKSFLHFLSRSGSVTFAALQSRLDRRTVYRLRANDGQFAAQWDEALNLGIDRLQDDAMQRALNGTERHLWRNGKQVGSVLQYDNKLLQFLLRAHRPEIYSEKRQSAVPPLPFDLAQRLAASAPRADAYDAAKEKRDGKSKKQGR